MPSGAPSSYTDGDYAAAMAALAPRGRAWPTDDPTSILSGLIAALARTWTRVDQAAGGLLLDAFPDQTNQLLPEWEASLGLPDPCTGPPQTLSEARGQVLARLTAGGGQSVGFFIGLAATLGYAITITEYTGASAHTWRVNAPSVTMIYFRAGSGRCGQALQTGTGTAGLECVFNRLAPAQTTIIYHYGP